MSLTSVATPIWNEIAETQNLKTRWAREAFSMNPAQMMDLESREFSALSKQTDEAVAASFLDVKPLLLENVAISLYTQDRPNLLNALPEVNSISEAVMLASMERPLSPSQQEQLRKLLEAEYQRQ